MVNGLLVCFISLVVFLPSHIGAQASTSFVHQMDLRMSLTTNVMSSHRCTSFETLGQVLNHKLLVLKYRVVLVIEPAQLLKDFGAGIFRYDTHL